MSGATPHHPELAPEALGAEAMDPYCKVDDSPIDFSQASPDAQLIAGAIYHLAGLVESLLEVITSDEDDDGDEEEEEDDEPSDDDLDGIEVEAPDLLEPAQPVYP